MVQIYFSYVFRGTCRCCSGLSWRCGCVRACVCACACACGFICEGRCRYVVVVVAAGNVVAVGDTVGIGAGAVDSVAASVAPPVHNPTETHHATHCIEIYHTEHRKTKTQNSLCHTSRHTSHGKTESPKHRNTEIQKHTTHHARHNATHHIQTQKYTNTQV